MPRLNQIVAVERGTKSTTESDITRVYHLAQRQELFAGLIKTYTPKDDEGETLPGESQLVVAKVPDLVAEFTASLSNLFDITATKVFANGNAKANVMVDDVVLVEDVPVEYLLFLEKRLIDVMTFLSKLPTLDPTFEWHSNGVVGQYQTDPSRTHRTKKVPRPFIKAVATDKHAAQVDVINEDETVGYWDTTRLSGAVTPAWVSAAKGRVVKLQAAVKFAREEANSIEVTQQKVAKPIFDYLFS